MMAHINDYSNQAVHRSTKISNTTNSFTHIVMQIMHDVFQAGDLSPRHLTFSMVPPLTDARRNNIKFPEAFPMQKQEQCTQYC